MIEKGKISAWQMAVIMYPTITATAVLLVPAITMKHAKQDLWISPIWASFAGFLTVYITYRLHKLYPDESVIEYSERILGRIAGKVLGGVYIFFYLHITGIIIREYSDFIATFLPLTPMTVVMGSIVVVCGFAVRGGIEVLGRSAEIFVPLVVFLLTVIIILLIPELRLERMLPVMENGLWPSFMGSIAPQGWLSEFFLLSFLLPLLADRHKGQKWGMLCVFFIMLTLVIINLMTLLLFGKMAGTLTYPMMLAARRISLAEFFEHLESVVMAIWVAGAFVKISAFYYIVTLGTAQWLKLSDYRPLVFPLGYILVLLSIWIAPNIQAIKKFLGATTPVYLLSMQLAIPLVLLFIAMIRSKMQSKGN
jgi:spore germination protein KB